MLLGQWISSVEPEVEVLSLELSETLGRWISSVEPEVKVLSSELSKVLASELSRVLASELLRVLASEPEMEVGPEVEDVRDVEAGQR